MKVKYQFVNEFVEIDVDEEWSKVMFELDRQEYNNNQKEMRRHTSLDGMNYEGEIFADHTEVEELIMRNQDAEFLREALGQLKPKQQDLINTLYLSDHPLTQSEYANKLGIAESSVKQNAWRAKESLRKILTSKEYRKKL